MIKGKFDLGGIGTVNIDEMLQSVSPGVLTFLRAHCLNIQKLFFQL